ncbi:hypothetical protein DF186_17065, partial [Enterococcus hirae]
ELLLAARERAAALAAAFLEEGKARVDVRRHRGAAPAPPHGAEQQVLLHRQLGEDLAALRHEGDARLGDRFRPPPVEAPPGEADCAAGGR